MEQMENKTKNTTESQSVLDQCDNVLYLQMLKM